MTISWDDGKSVDEQIEQVRQQLLEMGNENATREDALRVMQAFGGPMPPMHM